MIFTRKRHVFIVFFWLCFVLVQNIASADEIECNTVDPDVAGYRLIGKGVYYGEELEFNVHLPKTKSLMHPSIRKRRTRGMKSSGGGHSYQITCINADIAYLKLFIKGITEAGTVFGLNSSENAGETPYATIEYGHIGKFLYEKARSDENQSLVVNITSYMIDEEAGEAHLEGCLFADWGDSGNVRADFNVYIIDRALQPE